MTDQQPTDTNDVDWTVEDATAMSNYDDARANPTIDPDVLSAFLRRDNANR